MPSMASSNFRIRTVAPELGQKVELWVHYSDATVNLHRQMYGVRNREVETIFQIEH